MSLSIDTALHFTFY
jgi:hypothetical protein